jgi:hypothetical protein
MAMTEKPETQRTEQGLEIPVPTRGQIDDALARIAQPQKASSKRKRSPRKK